MVPEGLVSEACELERAELESLLSSGVFARAPNVKKFLCYICYQYFTGQADQIKEYTIAVDAFGRSPDFNQKKDPIVRVEAHRLRWRLKRYYETEGAGHSVHISLSPGQYVPVFKLVHSNGNGKPVLRD